MRSYRETLTLQTEGRRAFLTITDRVLGALATSGVREGLRPVNVMHITASVFVNDGEPGLHQDCEEWLGGLATREPVSRCRRTRAGGDGGDAHLKRQVMGREVVVAVTGGEPDFGPWEQIFYGGFDGRRAGRGT